MENGPHKKNCHHPFRAIYHGANQYGRYSHCEICGTRLTFEPTGNTRVGRSTTKKAEHQKEETERQKGMTEMAKMIGESVGKSIVAELRKNSFRVAYIAEKCSARTLIRKHNYVIKNI